MIIQRLVTDLGKMTGTITIKTNPGDPNSVAELMGLFEEMKLRINVETEGSIITQPPAEEIPPPVE